MPESSDRSSDDPVAVPDAPDDLYCMRCGYALAAPKRDERCPECGTPIAHSLDAPFEARGVRRMRRGARWLIIGTICLAAVTSLPTLASLFGVTHLRIGSITWVEVPLALIIVAGQWQLTGRIGPGRRSRVRCAAHGVAAVLLAFTISRACDAIAEPSAIDAALAAPMHQLAILVVLLITGPIVFVARRRVWHWLRPKINPVILAIGAGALLLWLSSDPVLRNPWLNPIYTFGVTLLDIAMTVLLVIWLMHVTRILNATRYRTLLWIVLFGATITGLADLGIESYIRWMTHAQNTLSPDRIDLLMTIWSASTAIELLSALVIGIGVLIVLPRSAAAPDELPRVVHLTDTVPTPRGS